MLLQLLVVVSNKGSLGYLEELAQYSPGDGFCDGWEKGCLNFKRSFKITFFEILMRFTAYLGTFPSLRGTILVEDFSKTESRRRGKGIFMFFLDFTIFDRNIQI